jgi:hypothetical protein
VTWHYRYKELTVLERSKDGITWNQLTEEELAEMTSNHLDFLECL